MPIAALTIGPERVGKNDIDPSTITVHWNKSFINLKVGVL
jgi:hypothetical protein